MGNSTAGGSDPLSTSREDLSFDSGYHHQHSSHANAANAANVPHSPGMQFAARGVSSANKQPLSKSPIYSSRIRESLTPPGKFYKDRAESPSRRAPESSSSGGGSGSGVKSHQQELQDKLASAKRSVGFDGAKLSSKYASSTNGGEARGGSGGVKGQRVPDSPPPPAPKSMKTVLNWGALEESLNQQV